MYFLDVCKLKTDESIPVIKCTFFCHHTWTYIFINKNWGGNIGKSLIISNRIYLIIILKWLIMELRIWYVILWFICIRYVLSRLSFLFLNSIIIIILFKIIIIIRFFFIINRNLLRVFSWRPYRFWSYNKLLLILIYLFGRLILSLLV